MRINAPPQLSRTDPPIFMTVEEGIVAYLKRSLTGVQVEKFPDRSIGLTDAIQTPCVFVGFQKVSGPPLTQSFTERLSVNQQRSYEFSVVIQVEELRRQDSGAYNLIHQIDWLLNGWQPISTMPFTLSMIQAGYVDYSRKTGDWTYAMTFQLPAFVSRQRLPGT